MNLILIIALKIIGSLVIAFLICLGVLGLGELLIRYLKKRKRNSQKEQITKENKQ